MLTDWRENENGNKYRIWAWKNRETDLVEFKIQGEKSVMSGSVTRQEAGDLVSALLSVLLP